MDLSWQLKDTAPARRLQEFSDRPFRVGITASPEDRLEQLHEGGEACAEMQVIYQTRNKSEVKRLERELSDQLDGYADVRARGKPEGPPFYLYVLLD